MFEKAKDNTASDNSNKQTEVETASYPQGSPATKRIVFNAIKSTRTFDINSVCALDVLKNCGYNWSEWHVKCLNAATMKEC